MDVDDIKKDMDAMKKKGQIYRILIPTKAIRFGGMILMAE